MFEDMGPERTTGRECKPDYEKLIAEKSMRLGLNKALYEALTKYIEGMRLSSALTKSTTLPEILGMLILEEKKLEKAIKELIEQQEKEKDRN